MNKKKLKVIIILFIIILLIAGYFIFLQKPQTAEADWWDDSWLYRQTVAITNSGTAQTDFQVMITVDTATLIAANKIQSDCDDIRITDINGKLIPHWIEPTTCNTATTKIWTKVPSISTSGDTVYLYYGNSTVTSNSDKTNTMLSWTQTTNDDFNGGVATKVTVSNDSLETNTVSVADGEWYVIDDDLVIVGTATGYLMWPRPQVSLGTNNNGTKQWKTEQTVGEPSWNSTTYVYNYTAGGCVSACLKANYPAFSWVEDLDFKGYTDWRIPTVVELQQLYAGREYITYTSSYYWANQQNNIIYARFVYYTNGTYNRIYKTNSTYVRAIRASDSTYTSSNYYTTSNLISSSSDTTTTSDFNNISWNGVTPAGTTIKYQIATNNDNSTWTFIGPDGTNATYYTTQEESIHSSHKGDRYIKYKAYLETTDNTVTPTLNDITIFYTKYSVSVSVGSPAPEERGPGPVAYWKFDEGFGQSANDSTINANSGTLGTTSGSESSDPTWQTEDMCVTGKCLKFDGVDDYVDMGNGGSLSSSNFTYSFWMKWTGANEDGYGGLVEYLNRGDQSNRMLIVDSTNNIIIQDNGVTKINSSFILNKNQWYFISLTFNGSVPNLYINGDLDTVGDNSSFLSGLNNVKLGIGAAWLSTYNFNGFIDDVKIYPYARTAAQIKADYASRGTASGTSAVILSDSEGSRLSDGLVGYWKMDEASWNGTADEVVDASGAGNDGVAVGAGGIPTTGAGKFGNGGVFDGSSSDYVLVADDDSLDVTDNFTMGAWIYHTGSTGYGDNILERSYKYSFSLNGYDKLGFYGAGLTPTTTSTTDEIPYNEWTYVTVTYNGSILNLYTNGVLKKSNNVSGSLGVGAQATIISRDGTSTFNGTLDEVRIYNRALSSSEVRDLYNWAPGPVGHWKMDEKVSGDAQTLNDISGNDNTGTTNDGANDTGLNCMVQGKYGSGCEFDGVDDYIEVPISNNLKADSTTISFWFRTNDLTKFQGLIGRFSGNFTGNENRIFWQEVGQRIQVYYRMNNTDNLFSSSSNVITDSNWHFISVMITNGSQKIYVDGIEKGSNTLAYPLETGDSNLTIGKTFSAGVLLGSIDDVRIYNYARTQAQILEDYAGGAGRKKQPIAHWKFDEGYGTTANNLGIGGTALNGTLTNMASPATSTSGWTNSGKIGKGLVFDGSNDNVNVGNNSALNQITNSLSLSFWMKGNSSYRYSTMISTTNPWTDEEGYAFGYLDKNSNNNITFYFDRLSSSKKVTSTSSLTDGIWYLVNGTYDGDVMKIYIDGVLENSTSGAVLQANTKSLIIGDVSTGDDWSTHFKGTIDDVKIYNYALTEDEIREEYNQGALLKLGSTGTDSSGNPDDSQSREYCIPGDTSTCSPPVGRWDFNEGTGSTVNDISGNNNTGTWSGTGSHWTQGKIGKGGSFNGSDDYVDAGSGSSLDITDTLTINAWIKASAFTASNGIVGKNCGSGAGDHHYYLSIYPNNNLNFYIGGGTCGSGNNDSLIATNYFVGLQNNWIFVTAVYDSGAMKLYRNGIFYTSKTSTITSLKTTSNNFNIGRYPNYGGFYWDGQIDQVRIYDYARTPAQIAWDYNRGKPIAHWKFDECRGGTAYDSSGNGNNGTITIGATGTQDGIGTCTDGDSSNAWYNGRTGKYNSAMSFDGSDDYVEISDSDSINMSGDMTILAWIKPIATLQDEAVLVRKASNDCGNYNFQIKTHKLALLSANECSWTMAGANSTVVDGVWQHVSASINGTTLKYYINGVNTDTITGWNIGSVTSDVLSIGGYSGAQSDDRFNGSIDEVKIYNYALTAEQIKNEYNQGAVNFR